MQIFRIAWAVGVFFFCGRGSEIFVGSFVWELVFFFCN